MIQHGEAPEEYTTAIKNCVKANIETRHMVIAWIIERVEIRANRKIHIKSKVSLDQFFGKSV